MDHSHKTMFQLESELRRFNKQSEDLLNQALVFSEKADELCEEIDRRENKDSKGELS